MRLDGTGHWRGRACVVALLGILALAGCGDPAAPAAIIRPTATATATTAPTATATSTPCPNLVKATATAPPALAPTPLAPANWTRYVNDAYHYGLYYPASWYALDVSPATSDFALLNYDPRVYRPNGDGVAPPPYNKIEVVALQGTEDRTPTQFYASNDTPNPLGPPECSRTTGAVTLGGHEALRIVQWPAASGYGPPTLYPAVRYYVSAGAGRPLLLVGEAYSPGGYPSLALGQLITNMTFAP